MLVVVGLNALCRAIYESKKKISISPAFCRLFVEEYYTNSALVDLGIHHFSSIVGQGET